MKQPNKKLRPFCLAVLLLTLAFTAPLWAQEILMSKAGFANWLQQAILPLQTKINTTQTQSEILSISIQELEQQIIRQIILKPGDKTVRLKSPGTTDEQSQTLDVAPLIQNGRTLVPLRFIGETLGARVDWNEATRQVSYTTEQRAIILTLNSTKAMVDGQSIALDVAPTVVSGRTLVPLRFVSEYLNAMVDWDATARTATVRYYRP